MPFVQMKAAGLHDDRHAFELPGDQLAFVACDPRLREAGDGAVWNTDRIGDFVGEKTQPRAEDDRDSGFQLAEAFGDRLGGLHHKRMPASVAERKFASVPAIIARNPRRARSCLRSGASAPMPPI